MLSARRAPGEHSIPWSTQHTSRTRSAPSSTPAAPWYYRNSSYVEAAFYTWTSRQAQARRASWPHRESRSDHSGSRSAPCRTSSWRCTHPPQFPSGTSRSDCGAWPEAVWHLPRYCYLVRSPPWSCHRNRGRRLSDCAMFTDCFADSAHHWSSWRKVRHLRSMRRPCRKNYKCRPKHPLASLSPPQQLPPALRSRPSALRPASVTRTSTCFVSLIFL